LTVWVNSFTMYATSTKHSNQVLIMNTSAAALIQEINRDTVLNLSVSFDSDDHVSIDLDGLVYGNAAHYIDIYADYSNVVRTAIIIRTNIIKGFEYERDQLAQRSVVLTNANRF
jgi:hypothetical protein